MATRAGQRNRRTSSLFLVAILAIAATISVSAYADTSGSSTLSITPPSTISGTKADVSSVAATFSGVQGQGQKTAGVVLSKLDFGDPTVGGSTAIEFIWTNTDQATGVLLNPNAWMETRIYFLDTDQQAATEGGYSGNCDSTTQRTFDDGGTKYVCPDPDDLHNFTVLSMSYAVASFLPSVDDQSVLYILADIHVPGGAPQGQQSQLNELTFNINVR